VNLAIVGGDLLFTAALSLLHDLNLPGERYREVLRLFSRVAATTGFGQAIDIVQGHVPLDAVREEELLREYHWKTAAYTFEGPMLSGAVAAGACKSAQEAISRFSLALGQAYQLQNDLIDLAAPAHEGCDLVQGKRTITLIRARAGLAESQRAGFDARLAAATRGGDEGIAIAESLRQELLDRGAIAATADVVSKLLLDSEAAASEPSLPQSLRTGLHHLLQSLRAAYFR
jgi:geranylgeranyl diphosphate synthase type I